MTLLDAILKAKTHEDGKYPSPPPEIEQSSSSIKTKCVDKYRHVRACVDSSPPRYEPRTNHHKLEAWRHNLDAIYMENIYLLTLIKKAHFMRGRVDCRWTVKPKRVLQYYRNRVDFLKRVRRDNLELYKRILNTISCLPTTRSLNRDWEVNRRKIVERANNAFVLFPPYPKEEMEDLAFVPVLPDVKRPRVYMKLGIKGGSVLGDICIELFTDVCPNTCRLFLDLSDGDTLGHGYVGTRFFRKIPHLYWSGGDVIHNNGFGCYAQRGRIMPIGAENYHFSHSMPGLLSMRVTIDDEMCGIFNITFKPLPQLDLRNVVFGRIVRPSSTYNIMKELGNVLSTRPVIEVRSTRRKTDGRWVNGECNTRLLRRSSGFLRKCLLTD